MNQRKKRRWLTLNSRSSVRETLRKTLPVLTTFVCGLRPFVRSAPCFITCLPPGVHHGAASVPDHVVIPLPRLRVDGLPHCTKTRAALESCEGWSLLVLYDTFSLVEESNTLGDEARNIAPGFCLDPYVSYFKGTGAGRTFVHVYISAPHHPPPRESADTCQPCCRGLTFKKCFGMSH